MTDKDLQGSSELYVKRSTRVLFAIGLVAFVLFLVLVFRFIPGVQSWFWSDDEGGQQEEVLPIDPNKDPYKVDDPNRIYPVGDMGLRASPSFVYKYMVPLNETSEEIVVLTAEAGSIRLGRMHWSQPDAPNNFQLEAAPDEANQIPACVNDLQMASGTTCRFKILWTPTENTILSNDLMIEWRPDSELSAPGQTFTLRVSESSGGGDCVCCADSPEPKLEPIPDTPALVDPVTGEVADIVAPDRVAVGLDGKVLGAVQNKEVIGANKKAIGRILPDFTIVDEQLNVLGAALPVLPVMNAKGEIIGEVVQEDGAERVRVASADGQTVGYVWPDGSVVNEQQLVGSVMPWSLVINYAQPVAVIGVTMKNGSVIEPKSKRPVGRVLPSGFVVNDKGDIVGGVVPKGVPMAEGCRTLGKVMPNGEIINEFQQQTGYVTPYGLVMDMNSIPQGRVVRQGLVFDKKGQPLAELNPQGRLNLAIGTRACVNQAGRVTEGGVDIGGVLPSGRIIGYDLQIQGLTFPDGGAYTQQGSKVGIVQTSGKVLDLNNQMLGVVIPKTTAITPACQMLGIIDMNGQVLNTQMQFVGTVNPDKQIIGTDKTVIGKATPIGALVDLGKDGKGIVGADGYVHSTNGRVIGCVSAYTIEENVVPPDLGPGPRKGPGKTQQGEPISDDPNPIEDIEEYVNKTVPPGAVVSIEGKVIGYYESGATARTPEGEVLGQVLPNRTVLAADTGKVIGAVIASGHPVIDLEGQVIAFVRADGQVVSSTSGENVGLVRADGLVLNAEGVVLGGLMPRGVVRDMGPTILGYVGDDGAVTDTQGQPVGRVQLNATVVNAQGDVVGAVVPTAQLAIGFDGKVLGTVGADGTLQAQQDNVKDAYITPTGLVIGQNGRIIGQTVTLGAVITLDRETSAWLALSGYVYNRHLQSLGRMMPDGSVVDNQQQLVAQAIPVGVATDLAGQFVGNISVDGRVISASGLDLGAFPYDDRLMNIKDNWIGRRLPAGVALDSVGKVIGVVRYDATVLNKEKQNIGSVLPDNRVVNDTQVLGQFAPYGALVQDEHGRAFSFVAFDGSVRDARGRIVGTLVGQQVVDDNNKIAGYLMPRQGFALDAQGAIIGHIFPSGAASSTSEGEVQENAVLPSGEIMTSTGRVIGQRAPFGLALGLDDNILGNTLADGRVLMGGVATVDARPDSVLYDKMQRVRGQIQPLGAFVNKDGHIVGFTSSSTAVNNLAGTRLGTLLSAGAAFQEGGKILGLSLPQTAVVDDDARVIGVVAADGAVVANKQIIGRMTFGGVAVQTSEQNPFSVMPEIGRSVVGELSVPMREGVVGYVQPSGHVLDMQKQVVGYVADDANVMSAQCEIVASTVQKGTVIDAQGLVIGSVAPDGSVLRSDGTVLGRLASDGTVKGSHVLKILGRIVPRGIVTNDTCQVVGQTRADGRVVDGQDSVVGTMQASGVAYSTLGAVLGGIAPQGAIVDTTGMVFGRTLANADVVDQNGTLMGCVLPNGQVVDTSNDHVGSVLKRGVVVNAKGRIIGRVKRDGSVVSPDCQNTVIGQAVDGGQVVDFRNEVIGAVFDPHAEQILYSDQGLVQGSVSADGVVRDVKKLGQSVFKVLENGDIYSLDGQLMARVDVSGNMMDTLGQPVVLVTSAGFNPDLPSFIYDEQSGTWRPTPPEVVPVRQIDCRGKKCFVDLGGGVRPVDDPNKVIALLNPNGEVTYIGDDSPTAQKVDPERLRKMRELLRAKRASMKRGIMNKLVPDKRLLARAKAKMTRDASNGAKYVSTWPVKMDRMILKDKAIPAVLQRSIDSRNVEVPVTAVVERHIYAEDGRNIIIPAGSRLIGQASGGAGMNRVAKINITWQRLVRPDGGTFHIEAVSGDAEGRGGVAGYLDEQFLARYGKPILESSLVSAVSYLIAVDESRTSNEHYGTVTQSDRAEAAQDARRNFIRTMQQIFEQMIEESSTVPPVVFIPAGTRLTVFANEDLWLRSEEDDVDDYDKQYGEDTKYVRKPDSRFGNSATYENPDMENNVENQPVVEEKKDNTDNNNKQGNQSTPSIEDFYNNGGNNPYVTDRVSTPLPTEKKQPKPQTSAGFF